MVKIGGSVISRETSDDKFEKLVVKRIAKELFPFNKRLILVHGTGYVGKPPAIKYGYYKDGHTSKKDYLEMLNIKEELRLLNHKFVETMLLESIPAMPFSITHIFSETMDHLKQGAFHELNAALELGYIPVFYGDLMPCGDGGFRVFSSDTITLILSRIFSPDKVLILSDVSGVYETIDDNDEPLDNKHVLKTLNRKTAKSIKQSSSDKKDVSGGMTRKISCALEIAANTKRCFIGSGFSPGVVSGFFKGIPVEGTLVEATG